MKVEIQNFIEEFHKIVKKGWIPSVNKGLGSVGLTFERELDKSPDSLFFSDYKGIELKCTTRYSRYPISLFSLTFDGPSFSEIYRIVEKYGYSDPVYRGKKILLASLNCKTKNLVSYKYKFKLEVDNLEEKLYLCIYDYLVL